MSRHRRTFLVAAGLVALLAAGGACGSGRGAPWSTGATARYDSDRFWLHFDHPTAWRASDFETMWSGSFGGPVVYLSTVRLHEPCTVTEDSMGRSTSCGAPLDHLPEGGVFATWDQVGVPGDDAAEAGRAGERLTIDDHPAWFDIERPGSCGLGADQTVSARIETDRPLTGATDETLDPAPGHWFQLTVCSRGGDPGEVARQARAMVDSVRLGR